MLYYIIPELNDKNPAQDEIRCKNFDVCGEEPPCVSGMVSGLCTKRCGMRGFGVLMLGGLILLTACSAPAVAGAAPASRQIIAMDTLMQFTVYGQEAEVTVQTAVEEVQRLGGTTLPNRPGQRSDQFERPGGRTCSGERDFV